MLQRSLDAPFMTSGEIVAQAAADAAEARASRITTSPQEIGEPVVQVQVRVNGQPKVLRSIKRRVVGVLATGALAPAVFGANAAFAQDENYVIPTPTPTPGAEYPPAPTPTPTPNAAPTPTPTAEQSSQRFDIFAEVFKARQVEKARIESQGKEFLGPEEDEVRDQVVAAANQARAAFGGAQIIPKSKKASNRVYTLKYKELKKTPVVPVGVGHDPVSDPDFRNPEVTYMAVDPSVFLTQTRRADVVVQKGNKWVRISSGTKTIKKKPPIASLSRVMRPGQEKPADKSVTDPGVTFTLKEPLKPGQKAYIRVIESCASKNKKEFRNGQVCDSTILSVAMKIKPGHTATYRSGGNKQGDVRIHDEKKRG